VGERPAGAGWGCGRGGGRERVELGVSCSAHRGRLGLQMRGP
jgi:hypothetical protein